MIDYKQFTNSLIKNKINFFTGVPDSLFKSFCSYLETNYMYKNFITANEGSAIGIGIGYYLATGRIPLIYLQNSGLGNTINPLTSLADLKVYSIPLFLMIGWRGEVVNKKQLKDEPQHKKQGLITEKILKVMGIKYLILSKKSDYKKSISLLKKYSLKKSKPVALLIRKKTFKKYLPKNKESKKLLTREETLKEIIKSLQNNSIKVSTTGMLSRELNEINESKKNSKNTFMCVGGMGHAISIATGIALKKKQKIYCFDGDGSFMMHLGSAILSAKLKNLVHIVFNNKTHDSVGGQKTISHHLSLSKIAKSLGYSKCYLVKNKYEINKVFKSIKNVKKSIFIEVLCKKGYRQNLSRPNKKLIQLKKDFIRNFPR